MAIMRECPLPVGSAYDNSSDAIAVLSTAGLPFTRHARASNARELCRLTRSLEKRGLDANAALVGTEYLGFPGGLCEWIRGSVQVYRAEVAAGHELDLDGTTPPNLGQIDAVAATLTQDMLGARDSWRQEHGTQNPIEYLIANL